MKNKIIILLGLILLSLSVFSKESTLKIICDETNVNIYLNEKYIAKYEGSDISINLTPGKYNLIARKDLDDGSYYYFEKEYEFGESSVRIIADVQMYTIFPEKYYYKSAKMTKDISYYEEYLDKYPNGVYSKSFNTFLEEYYVSHSDNMEICKKYLKKYPNGKNSSLIQASLESLYFERFIKNNNILYGEEYLNKYPYGKFVDKVKNVINNLKPKGIIDVYPTEFSENDPLVVYFSANKSKAIWKYRKALNRKNSNIPILPSEMFIRYGFNGWAPEYLFDEKEDPRMEKFYEMGEGVWKYELYLPNDESIKEVNFTFKDEFNNWDTNLTKDYTVYLVKEGSNYKVVKIDR